MIQFNIHRFGKLACWTLRNERNFLVRNTLQMLVAMSLIYLFFTLGFLKINGSTANYPACGMATLMMFTVFLTIGPGTMFNSMKGKYDRQALLMLPASNFEKYLMRYASWLILLPLFIVSVLCADLIQYAVNYMLGNEKTMFVVSKAMELLSRSMTDTPAKELNGLIIPLACFHAAYALGGTFFRSPKYAWVFTTLVIILIVILMAWLLPSSVNLNEQSSDRLFMAWNILTVVWVILAFWLSYKVFCKTQVIGKYVNL